MDNPAELPAAGTQAPAPPEDRQPRIERQGPDDYAQWLDGWMFDDEEQQKAKA